MRQRYILMIAIVLAYAACGPVSAAYTFDCSPTYGCVDYGTKYLNDTILFPGPADLDKYCQETLGSGWLASSANKTNSIWGTGSSGYFVVNLSTYHNPVSVNVLTSRASTPTWHMANGTYYLESLCGSYSRTTATTHPYNWYGSFTLVNVSAPTATCSYTASPTIGPGPLSVSFQSTTPSAVAWEWAVILNTTGAREAHFAPSESWQSTFYTAGTYDVNLTAYTTSGSCMLFDPNALTVANPANVTIGVQVYDGSNAGLIYGATVGIFDYDDLVWSPNQTAPSGYVTFGYSGAANEHPLTVGKQVLIGASASGYVPAYANVTIPYSGYILDLPLYRTDIFPTAGNATVAVNVVKNSDSSALQGASVYLENTGRLYGQIKSTNAVGVATFMDLPVAQYNLEVSKSGYQTATMMIEPPVNEITTVDISLVAVGATPTPTVTGTGAVTGATTTSASAAWRALSAEEQDEGIWDLIRDNAWELVSLAIIVVIMTMLGWIIKSPKW